MIEDQKPHFYKWRFWLVLFILGLGVLGLFWRMIQLTVLERNFLQKQGNARIVRTLTLPAYRGMISDRNGYPLAISSPAITVWANPQEVDLTDAKLQQLAKHLGEKFVSLKKQIAKNKDREFIYLKRQIDPAKGEKIKDLNITGIYFQQEYKRFYPEGEVMAHVVGFTDIDEQGQEGIELAFNDWLKGSPGKQKVIKDRLGHIVEVIDQHKMARPGNDLILSIDHRIQYLAYRELKQAMTQYAAKAGSIVILDVKTGEVLAMVNQPSYNPNQRPTKHDGRYRNRAVTDLFEPGSTIKAFSITNALASGKYTPESTVDTSPGWMVLNGKVIDDHRNKGEIDLTTILQKSSNVGVSKVTLSLEPDSLYDFLEKMGFGELTEIEFPGGAAGYISHESPNSELAIATLSFGYGLAVTNIQLAGAYAILANHGIKQPLTLLKSKKLASGAKVIKQRIANQVLTMLETVVDQGTAKRAHVYGYRVLGKTGTVRKVGPNGYDQNHHIGLFVGAAPASDPRIVVSVVIDDPQSGQFYGGLVAAPVFANVVGGSLRLLDLAPDAFDRV